MKIMTFNTHQGFSAIISPYKYTLHHSCEGCVFSLDKTCNVSILEESFVNLGIRNGNGIGTDTINKMEMELELELIL